jgi:hypothetical protein
VSIQKLKVAVGLLTGHITLKVAVGLLTGHITLKVAVGLLTGHITLKVAVGLLTGHITLKVHMFKLGLTQRQDCQLCGDERRLCTSQIIY